MLAILDEYGSKFLQSVSLHYAGTARIISSWGCQEILLTSFFVEGIELIFLWCYLCFLMSLFCFNIFFLRLKSTVRC